MAAKRSGVVVMDRQESGTATQITDAREEGNARFQAQDFKGAIAAYTTAINAAMAAQEASGSLTPQEASDDVADGLVKCFTNRAMSHFKLEDYKKCVQDCNSALAIDNGCAKARYRRACAYRQSGRPDLAVRDLRGCDPKDQKSQREIAAQLEEVEREYGYEAGAFEEVDVVDGDALDGDHQEEGGSADMERGKAEPLAVGDCVKANGYHHQQPEATFPPPPLNDNVVRVTFSSPAGSMEPSAAPLLHPALQAAGFSAQVGGEGWRVNGMGKRGEAPPSRSLRDMSPRKRQRRDIRRLFSQMEAAPVEPGDVCALLPAHWWQSWKAYTGFTEAPRDDRTEGSDHDDEAAPRHVKRPPPPPPIDTRRLFAPEGGLKRGLVEGRDFVVVPREVWEALQSWFGGGPPVLRTMVETPEGEPELDLLTNEDVGTADEEPAAGQSPARNQKKQLMAPCVVCEELTTSRCSKCHKAAYCGRGCQASHWRYHKPHCRDDGKPLIDMPRRGEVGLINLGNTCYMNSALQCLSHTYPLTMHFLTNRFKNDLNTTSLDGTGGRLAQDMDHLLKEMWFGSSYVVNPGAIKRHVAQRRPAFVGHAQQDAHELLGFLIDLLHEDLNRVQHKPYTQVPEEDDRPERLVANEMWDLFDKREDSVLVENLYGQFKSTLVCPDCGKVSVVFEPFNVVPLDIPDPHPVTLRVLFFPYVHHALDRGGGETAWSRPRFVSVKVSRHGSVFDLRQDLSEMVDVKRENILIAQVANHMPLFYADNDRYKVSHIIEHLRSEGGSLVAYETPPVKQDYVLVYHRELRPSKTTPPAAVQSDEEGDVQQLTQDDDDRPHTPVSGVEEKSQTMIGVPLLLCCDLRMSAKEFRSHVWRQVRRIFSITPDEAADPAFVDSLSRSMKIVVTDGEGKDIEVWSTPSSPPPSAPTPPPPPATSPTRTEDMEGSQPGSPVSALTDPTYAGAPACAADSAASQQGSEDGGAAGRAQQEDSQRLVEHMQHEAEPQKKQVLVLDDPDTPVVEVLAVEPGKERVAYVAVDWEGPLAGRCAELDDDGRPAVEEWQGDVGQYEFGLRRTTELTLDQCLTKFSRPERLDRDNSWYCNKCKKHRQAVKTLQLWRLPRVLVITLKRFAGFRERKLETLVKFPIDGLDVTPHCLGVNGHSEIYDLFAVSNHYGSRSWGHYTAFARRWDCTGWMDTQFYKFDDSDCEPIHSSKVVSPSAYILFYRRREGGRSRDQMNESAGDLKSHL